jgi:hypothetical protein
MKFSIALSFVSIILSGLTHVSALSRRDDPQTSLTLHLSVIAKGFEQNGQKPPVAGQVASLTSTNNFINFCLTVPNLPITNGKQIASGSCNPAPMGAIPSSGNMPFSQFTNPTNGAIIPANEAFTISMNIYNLDTGYFVNANTNYFSAPQQVNAQGMIYGHSHVVIQPDDDLDPTKFTYFKGLNNAAQGGALTDVVAAGIPAGSYRICSIHTAANHQPVLGPIAQHGAFNDCRFFKAVDADGASASNTAAASSSAAAATATDDGGAGANTAATATTTSAAGAAATDKGDAGANTAATVTSAAGAAAADKGDPKASATDSAAATATGNAATSKNKGKVSRAGGIAQR